MKKPRFSLATLLALVTVAAIWLAKLTNDARQQERAVKVVESNEGIVQFEATLDVPQWLRDTVGEEYFRNPKVLDFATNNGRKQGTGEPKATDANLDQLASFRNIHTIELGSNYEVTDAGLAHLRTLRDLTTLYLYRTGVRGSGLAHLMDLPKLEAISLDYTELQDSGTKHLGNMSSLKWAALSNTRLTDASMPDIARASALETLTLRNTEITDDGLKHLEQLHHLGSLDVSGTKVTADGVADFKQALPNCRVIVTFGLGETPSKEPLFAEGVPIGADEINFRLKELKIDGEVETDVTRPANPIISLRLFDTLLADNVVLSLIEHMPDLEVLNFRRALIGDEFLKGIVASKVRFLSLQSTRITDDGLRHLPQLDSLRELVLAETHITDEGILHLQRLDKLNSVILSNTRVTTDGVARLKQALPNCNVTP